jgi:sulfite exporter TauE/SafE
MILSGSLWRRLSYRRRPSALGLLVGAFGASVAPLLLLKLVLSVLADLLVLACALWVAYLVLFG